MSQTNAALSIRRRTAALALFQGVHLMGVIVRHVPTDGRRAESTIAGFVREACSRHEVESIGIEQGTRTSLRIVHCYECAKATLQQESTPIEEVQYAELLESYAFTPLRLRHQLRQVAKRIWPMLDNKKFGITALDAAVVGLHLQTRRLLNIQTENT